MFGDDAIRLRRQWGSVADQRGKRPSRARGARASRTRLDFGSAA
jgi:hypothetical protein